MKKLLLSALVPALLFGCGSSSDNEITKVIEDTKLIEIEESNASELIDLTSNFEMISDSFIDSQSNISRTKTSSECAFSGSMEESFSENSDGSFEAGLTFTDCMHEIDTVQNGKISGKGNVSEDLSSVSITLSGDMRTVTADNYIDMDIQMSVKGDSAKTTMTYKVDYDIALPGLVGEVTVSTNPSLVIDSNYNLTGKVIIEGKNSRNIEIDYTSNGTNYYLNGTQFTPVE